MASTSRSVYSTEMAREAPAQSLETSEGGRCRAGCEKTTGEDREEVEDEAGAEKRPSVLWEKYFEQSIFVDISDDDSLHMSDLQGSFRVHISQHEESENTGLSDSNESEEDSTESSVSISSVHRDHINARDMKGNKAKDNTAPERPRWRPEDDNTSDEDQEELPYDGELHHHHHHTLHPKESPEETSKDHHTVNADMLYTPSTPNSGAENVKGGIYNRSQPVAECFQQQEPSPVPASVPEFLLRHFSHDELLNCGRLIEAETMPEVSLLESVDETAWSRASANPHTAGVGGHCSKLKACLRPVEEDESSRGRNHTDNTEITDLKMESARTAADQNNMTDEQINHNQSNSTEESRLSVLSDLDAGPSSSAEDEQKENEDEEDEEEDVEEDEEDAEQCCSASTPDLDKADVQVGRFSLGRTRSCSELKYGQGQVHYPLPDFSKVAPKVKIPKGNSPTKPGTHTPSTDRPHTTTAGTQIKSPSSCSADVISRVLEDSVWLSEVRKDEEEQARLDQLLQAEYNRLLAKYAVDDNLINQTQQTQDSINQPSSTLWKETVDVLDDTQGQPRAAKPTFQSTIAGLFEERKDAERMSLPEQQSVTDGQRLTAELTTIIYQFTEQMEEFKNCISTMSMTIEEQQKVFKSMMEAQDQLERNYMSKKEEHRVLEMQNYMGLNRNTGQFDPDRQVEGEIFRLGMQLEDIKEQIDRNACRELSPPPVSSTPTPSPHGEFIPSSSHQPSLHEESVFSFPAGVQSMAEEEEHSQMTEAVDEESRAADFRLHTFSQMPCISREDEEGSLSLHSEVDEHEDFLAQLTEQLPSEHQRTSDGPAGPEDLESPTPDSPDHNTAQRFVSLETDSGFSTSDLSRPPTGLSHTQCNTDRLSPSDDINSMSASDNEASRSDLHTAVSLTTWAGWPKMGESEPDPLSEYVPNMQENNTTQNAPAGPHISGETPVWGEDGATLHSAPLQEPSQEEQFLQKQRPTAAEMPTRDKHSRCSCSNSDAISALQSEVSRLKRVLEESLGHLPHLCMRMDHLSNMYTQEKRLRSRPRLRHQNRPPSKGTDSGDSDHSDRPASFKSASSYTHSRSPSITQLHHLKYSSTASLESLSQDMSQSRPRSSHQRASVGPSCPDGSVSAGPSCYSSDVSIEPFRDYRRASVGPARRSSSVSVGSASSGSRTSARPDTDGSDASFRLNGKRSQAETGYRPPGEKPPLHKPLLQTNYGSCNSLPPGFKVQDQLSDSEVSSRRRTTQSDSAILPSNVYFQRTSPLPTSPCRSRARPRRQRASKEEAINRTLDKALEAAMLMKQTTDRMAKTLSTDLAKAQTYRKLNGLHPDQPRLDHSSYHTLH
uniref:AKNA domain containing 1 n=1 Tax=Astyanax mexicanus TaxID=7994 RepID=A0A3B1KFF8_ASTMX